MHSSIKYTASDTEEDLLQILQLQQENLPKNISGKEAKEQGFVTLEHNLELLTQMNTPYPHAIAKNGDELVGYALMMLPHFFEQIPGLLPMRARINSIKYQGQMLKAYDYFVMGQVCIKKGYRGRGILKNMYGSFKKRLGANFDFMLTEVASKNTRSMRAHEKLGFELVKAYQAPSGAFWNVILLDLS